MTVLDPSNLDPRLARHETTAVSSQRRLELLVPVASSLSLSLLLLSCWPRCTMDSDWGNANHKAGAIWWGGERNHRGLWRLRVQRGWPEESRGGSEDEEATTDENRLVLFFFGWTIVAKT